MIKEILAPSIASSGMMMYWKGKYKKSHDRLIRAERWCPDLFINSEFQGYLGLCLYKLGNIEESKIHLIQTQKYLNTIRSTDTYIRQVQKDLKKEIDEILPNIIT